jgi:hypothetical protein
VASAVTVAECELGKPPGSQKRDQVRERARTDATMPFTTWLTSEAKSAATKITLALRKAWASGTITGNQGCTKFAPKSIRSGLVPGPSPSP